MLKPRLLSAALTTLLVMSGLPVTAQRPITVSGTVRDASGAVLPDTFVELLIDAERVDSAVTDASGRYSLALRSDATHRLVVTRAGFEVETVELPAATTSRERDVIMRVAAFGDTVVVTASGTEALRTTVNESITVLEADDVRAMGANSLAEVVNAVPALNVESTGREGALASLFSRGGESDYNLVLIDGVRANITGGRFNFSRVSAGEIERVEVVRGAQSSLYGSAAIGSVVQVITRRAAPTDAPTVSGSVEGGSFATGRADLSLLGGALQRFDYKASAAFRTSDGAFEDLLPERDRYQQSVFNGGFGAVLGQGASLRLTGRYSDADGRSVGPIVYGARDTGTRFDSRDRAISVQYRQAFSGAFEHSATAAYFDSDSVSVDAVADPPYFIYAILEGAAGALFPDSPRLVRLISEPEFAALAAGPTLPAGQYLVSTPSGVSDFVSSSTTPFRRPSFAYRANIAWATGQTLSAGYEYERESQPDTDGWVIGNHAWFVQQQFAAAERWFLSLGARIDDNSRFGTEVSPKVSLGGFLLPPGSGLVSSVRTFFNFGHGIKNPVFSELFGSAFVDGNPTLHPERARTVDAGVETTFADQYWLARVAYFNNDFEDQVAFFASGPVLKDGIADYINVDGSRAAGWELELALQRPIAGVTASAGYAYVDTEVTSSVNTSDQFQPGQPLLRRPAHSASAQVRYQGGPFGLALTMRRVGERHDSAFMPLRTLTGEPANITVNPAYTWLGLTGEVRVHDAVGLYVTITNLADTEYESALGFPGLPRAVVAGARFDLGAR